MIYFALKTNPDNLLVLREIHSALIDAANSHDWNGFPPNTTHHWCDEFCRSGNTAWILTRFSFDPPADWKVRDFNKYNFGRQITESEYNAIRARCKIVDEQIDN